MNTEILRSSFSLDGIRIFLIYDRKRTAFRLATRYRWLATFVNVFDACDAFEALELIEGDEVAASKHLVREIARVPRHTCANRGAGMDRIAHLVRCVERRLAGFRPMRTGSKGSVEVWITV